MKVIAIIPARGGSKGILKKNLVNFLGKPLLEWSIEAALNSKYITEVVVSSDDEDILRISQKYMNVISIKRPEELAQDTSRTEPVLAHVIECLKDTMFDYLILLQPTSPLRKSDDIDEAFNKLLASPANSLISVCSNDYHPYKSLRINNQGFLEGIINNEYPFLPRQELPQTYSANGAIYIIKVKEFIKNHSLITSKTLHFKMSVERSLDIDSKIDLIK
jgi:N-acylneuraminate cytidylyltransferase